MVIKLLGRILGEVGRLKDGKPTPRALTDAVVTLAMTDDGTALSTLCGIATDVIDEYLNPASEEAVQKETLYLGEFGQDLNAFLKADKLGSEEHSPKLNALIGMHYRVAGGIGTRKEIVSRLS